MLANFPFNISIIHYYVYPITHKLRKRQSSLHSTHRLLLLLLPLLGLVDF
jgi:hypothetical protein